MNAIAKEFKVIDTDTHIVEPYDLWTSRLSAKKFGDKIPRVRWDEKTQEDVWYFGDTRLRSAAGPAMAGWHEYPPNHPRRLTDVDPALYDAPLRLKRMDEYGIHAQILYGNVAGHGAGKYTALGEDELMLASVEAYNDWLAEWASADPKRLIPQLVLPFWSVQASIKEMRRAADKGHKGVVMCGEPEFYDLPKLTDPHWYPLWAAAQDMQLPVNFHIGTGDMWYYNMLHESIGKHAHFASLPPLFSMDNAKVIVQLITGGICHKFPKVNFVSVESGIGWIPYLLENMDYQWLNCGAHKENPEYKLLPSEFFKRQIYGCFWFEKGTIKPTIEAIGADNILYETDFPHPTSMSPGPCSAAVAPADYMEEALKGVARDDIRKIVHDNAVRLYHLD